ncbi:DNA recombination protein RmuC [Microbacterium sp. YY-01]|uniref:DNA recombination protein RmuC n=1 Tax=Microbacterium sp. YY-01 TaxID=3421634 RepID=UPI003D183CDF
MPDVLFIFLALAVGVALGAVVGVLFARTRSARLHSDAAQQITRLETQIDSMTRSAQEREQYLESTHRDSLARTQKEYENRLADQEKAFTEREDLIRTNHEETQQRIKADHAALREQFEALASEALDKNSKRFLDVANERLKRSHKESAAELEKREQLFRSLVEPMKETLNKVENQTVEAEKLRVQTQEALTQQIHQMMQKSDELGKTTESLRSALRRPEIRGRWGELHLRRVVEVAGLVNGVDFVEQSSDTTDEGHRLRPDMIVTLSGGRKIIVDAKAPLDAILDIDTDPENAEQHARRHVKNVRERVKELNSKPYRQQFGSTIDFSVLFLPAESFLQVATEQDPQLLTDAYESGVIIATPTVLVAMLRTVAQTWKAEALAQNAQDVLDTGKELYKRLSTMGGHIAALGKAIDRATDAYNRTVGSLERQVLPQARRFADLQQIDNELDIAVAEKTARDITAPELTVSLDTTTLELE